MLLKAINFCTSGGLNMLHFLGFIMIMLFSLYLVLLIKGFSWCGQQRGMSSAGGYFPHWYEWMPFIKHTLLAMEPSLVFMSMFKHKALCWLIIISNKRYLWFDDEAVTKDSKNDMKQTKSMLPTWSWVWGITHWDRYKMNAISQTTLSSAFSRMKIFEFRLKFHWGLFLRCN